jgi:hypothetical protein
VLVVDELQVHVHEHGVQDQGQLVPVDVKRALNKLFQVAEIKNERQSITLRTEMNCAILNIYRTYNVNKYAKKQSFTLYWQTYSCAHLVLKFKNGIHHHNYADLKHASRTFKGHYVNILAVVGKSKSD